MFPLKYIVRTLFVDFERSWFHYDDYTDRQYQERFPVENRVWLLRRDGHHLIILVV